jgi:hypothetical protein
MSDTTHTIREAAWDITHDTEHRLRSENLAFDIGVFREGGGGRGEYKMDLCAGTYDLCRCVTAAFQMFGILAWPTSLREPSSFLCANARLLQLKSTYPEHNMQPTPLFSNARAHCSSTRQVP